MSKLLDASLAPQNKLVAQKNFVTRKLNKHLERGFY
uniref:Uncharacterized protein n=1 Tax=Rhizophora mucronata TaxID=61149 RepID=A0A2P2QUU4_RHIMU